MFKPISPQAITCVSPIPPSVRPSFEVPPRACDCHAHVYGFPPHYEPGGDKRYIPSADSQVQDYVRMLQSLGIQRAVLVQPTIYRDNQVTLDGMDVLRAAGIDARGIALVDPAVDSPEIARLDAAGIRGVRIHLREASVPRGQDARIMKQLDPLIERIGPFGWHLQLHVHGNRLQGLREWVAGLPVPVVLDHFGRVDLKRAAQDPGYEVLLRMLSEQNCWVKLSAVNRFDDPTPPYPSLRSAVQELIAFAPDRLLWGTDWPHSSFKGAMPSDAALLDILAYWTADASVRHRILVANPERLYFSTRTA
ncbi:amidohydrolase family protein [Candidimonas nitroreducens]|uniref:Amidohydrolase-related domain-containing protein n=1 Tax=Candidimonas nitroreducens TaxID=683354 RepID=A0A225MXA3_9BURK|nr:amidohydrolase family protein [Candidimonas nitroreducens]OWT65764.1 hypothetical protein CEY11_03280 [Candidimonas nitroreducens]